MLALQDLKKSFGARAILNDVNVRISAGVVAGLVGPNGAGKTTLLEVISGDEEADAGLVSVPRGATIGFLPQEIELQHHSEALIDVILDGRSDLIEMEERLTHLAERLEAEPDLSEEYTSLQEQFEVDGGYIFRSRAREIAVGIGFRADDLKRPIDEFSGGWQMRALLARLLLTRPDILLLDEPTNHLDIESVEWLERFLKRYEGIVIIVSHDRYFINQLVDEILELERGKLTRYVGNYDAYRKKKELLREQLEKEAAQQAREIKQIEEFIERFRYKATKAAQVQSRIKMLEKLERVETMRGEKDAMKLRFPQPPRLGKHVLVAENVHKSFDENVVYDGLDFQLIRGDKVALVGPNGAGKTTLLRMMAGELEPDSGKIRYGAHVETAYFAQHALDQLNPECTILEELNNHATIETAPMVRDVLGAFLFSGDDVNKRISVLSGGEKSRVALAKLMLEPAGLLLLDEPTNHLDIPSRQVLEDALQTFTGVVVIVSHDRFFINEVVEKTIHIEDGKATTYLGNYEYYRRKRAELEPEEGTSIEVPARDESAPLSKKELRQRSAELRRQKSDELDGRGKELEALESKIMEIEEAIEANLETLADPAVYEDTDRATKLAIQNKSLETELVATMELWEELGAEVDAIEAKYAALEEEMQT